MGVGIPVCQLVSDLSKRRALHLGQFVDIQSKCQCPEQSGAESLTERLTIGAEVDACHMDCTCIDPGQDVSEHIVVLAQSVEI